MVASNSAAVETAKARRMRLEAIVPASRDVDVSSVSIADYAIRPRLSEAQKNALLDATASATDQIGQITVREVAENQFEILTGIPVFEAYTAMFRFGKVRVNPAILAPGLEHEDALFYAIERAYSEYTAAGFHVSVLDYARSVERARRALTQTRTVGRPPKDGKVKQSAGTMPWSHERLAYALCVARSTLTNRLHLIESLDHTVQKMVDTGKLPVEAAKVLSREKSATRQHLLAAEYSRGRMTCRELYQRVYPNYSPPKLVKRSRRAKQYRLGDLGILERNLQERFGAPAAISVNESEDVASFVELKFNSLSELKGLLERVDSLAQTDHLFSGELTFTAADGQATERLFEELGAKDDLDTFT